LDFVYQKKLLGIGNALYTARDLIDENLFFMLIPDQFIYRRLPFLQIFKVYKSYFKYSERLVLGSLVKLSVKEADYFSGVKAYTLKEIKKKRIFQLRNFSPKNVCINGKFVRGFGRTLFSSEIFKYLTTDFLNPNTGEVDLYLTFKNTFGNFHHYGVLLSGKTMDFGNWRNFIYFSQKTKGDLIP
jgi:UTP-glucose-1-phosphate uridylyltransferase